MSQGLSDEKVSEIRDAFNLFDRKGDGKIDVAQIGDVLRALGQNPTEAEVRKVASDCGKQRLSFEDFLPIYTSFAQKKDAGSQEAFVEGLKVFDRDGNGTITSVELRHVLTSLGEKLTPDEVDQLLTGMEDSNGHVQYEEFIKTIMSG